MDTMFDESYTTVVHDEYKYNRCLISTFNISTESPSEGTRAKQSNRWRH